MKLVILESPFRADSINKEELHKSYARAALRDSLLRGESPIASHLLYTQKGVLDDKRHLERQLGIEAGLAWQRVADRTVVYKDLGISPGMEYGVKAALNQGIPVEYRTITGWTNVYSIE